MLTMFDPTVNLLVCYYFSNGVWLALIFHILTKVTAFIFKRHKPYEKDNNNKLPVGEGTRYVLPVGTINLVIR